MWGREWGGGCNRFPACITSYVHPCVHIRKISARFACKTLGIRRVHVVIFVKSAVVVWAPVLVYFQFVTGKRECGCRVGGGNDALSFHCDLSFVGQNEVWQCFPQYTLPAEFVHVRGNGILVHLFLSVKAGWKPMELLSLRTFYFGYLLLLFLFSF